jgi:hypothetical protein
MDLESYHHIKIIPIVYHRLDSRICVYTHISSTTINGKDVMIASEDVF